MFETVSPGIQRYSLNHYFNATQIKHTYFKTKPKYLEISHNNVTWISQQHGARPICSTRTEKVLVRSTTELEALLHVQDRSILPTQWPHFDDLND
jgi:hypothetical protein